MDWKHWGLFHVWKNHSPQGTRVHRCQPGVLYQTYHTDLEIWKLTREWTTYNSNTNKLLGFPSNQNKFLGFYFFIGTRYRTISWIKTIKTHFSCGIFIYTVDVTAKRRTGLLSKCWYIESSCKQNIEITSADMFNMFWYECITIDIG